MIAELGLILLGGLLGSAHCFGMCGGFALTLGLNAGNQKENFLRQAVFGFGRIVTYSWLGLLAGLGGKLLAGNQSQLLPWQAVLAILAGIILLLQGFKALGWRLPKWRFGMSTLKSNSGMLPILNNENSTGCTKARLFQGLLRGRGMLQAWLAGMVVGFLPCGLVYAFLALAAARVSLLNAWLTMAVFGIGTLPGMILTGLGAGWCSPSGRRKLWRVAAICLVISGVLSCWRGVMAWPTNTTANDDTPPPCPFCQSAAHPTAP